MKAIAGKQIRGIQNGTRLDVIDNSGAKVIEVITVPGYKGVSRRISSASLGHLIVASVKKGNPKMRKQIVYAIVVRQKRPVRRPNGKMIFFEDNAAVITSDVGELKGTDIKGPVAKEAAERWPKIASSSSMVV